MTAPSGAITVSFAVADVNPWVNANYTAIGTGVLQVVSNAAKSTGAGHRTPCYRFNGSMQAGATIKNKVEVGNNAGGGDAITLPIVNTSGTGYQLYVNGTTFTVHRITTVTTVAATLSSNSSQSASSGDILELWLLPDTPTAGINTFQVYKNGSIIAALTTTDSTTTSGLAPAIGLDEQNSNNSTILSWAADGPDTGVSGTGATTEASGDTASGSGATAVA